MIVRVFQARRIAPHDCSIIYNVALVLQNFATQTLENDKSGFNNILQAANDLKLSHRYDQTINVNYYNK